MYQRKKLRLNLKDSVKRYGVACTILHKGAIMYKYECEKCGYVYDPQKGDPDSGIEPGTAFEDIPDDWVCPDCGASKEDFIKVHVVE